MCLSSKLPDPKVSLKLKRHYKKFKAALTTEDMLRFRQSYTIYISEIDGARDSGIGRSELTDRDVALIMTMVELAEGYYDSIWPNTFRDLDSDLIKDNGFFIAVGVVGKSLFSPKCMCGMVTFIATLSVIGKAGKSTNGSENADVKTFRSGRLADHGRLFQ